MTTIPVELLERIAKPVFLRSQEDAHADACAELRALLSEQPQAGAGQSRDWQEDFDHENGLYFNTCCFCKEQFTGHKRRVVCKLCATEQPPARNDQGDEVLRDAERYRYMRAHARFEHRNGPGLYWYLPRNLTGGAAQQLDQAIDAALNQSQQGAKE